MTAEVYLWGTRIGVVAQEEVYDIPRFNYDNSFLESGIEVSPITMPLNGRVYSFPNLNRDSFHGLPGLIADSLPDKFGTKLLERYLAEQGRSIEHMTAVERLCYVGKRGMGALEYVPSKNEIGNTSKSIDVDALVQLASDILSERESIHINADAEMMKQIIQVGTSAGGARAKAIIAWNEETKDIRSGQINAGQGYGYWLIKFDGVEKNRDKGDKDDGPSYTRIEYAYHLMAKAAGIYMSDCRLYEESGKYHFMTKRFDRDGESGKKIHMQTLGGLAHYDYNMPGAHGYEQVAEVIYRLGMGQDEIEQLYRRMVFNIIARNQDDHVKNISFLMDNRGIWSLAPAYDITFAYDPTNYWLSRHQMSMNSKLDNFVLDDFYESGKRMNIKKRRVENILTEISDAIQKWPDFASEAKLKEEVTVDIKKQHLII